jgi:CubicO group peptidase (beta-lactamase class C family)
MRITTIAVRALLVLLFLRPVVSLTTDADSLDVKIDRVVNGLRYPIAIRGRESQHMAIADRLAYYKIPGVSIAVISGGRLEWARGFGATALKSGKAVDTETLFQAASISKHVAAIVALRLVEQGKLSLDEDVNLKLRSWKVPENEFTKTEKVTLRRLLNHSAGLTVHGFPGYDINAPVPTLLQVLDGHPPANTGPIRVDTIPGSLWRYSGGGYEVMQQLVMDVTRKPFAQLARELVLDPLGMTHSTFGQPLPAGLDKNVASAHRADGSMITGNWHVYPEQTAAGLWTTPADLAKVVIELQSGGTLLKPATVREMLTKVKGDYGLGLTLGESVHTDKLIPRKHNPSDRPVVSAPAPGTLGTGKLSEDWDIWREPWFSHGGANEGYRCMMFAYAEGGRGAIVMTNGDRGSQLADEILRAISAEYGWLEYRQKEKTLAYKRMQSSIAHYEGDYQFADGRRATISVESGHNWIKLPSLERIEIFLDQEGTFGDFESHSNFFDLEGRLPRLVLTTSDDGGAREMILGNQKAQPVNKP